MRGLKLDSYAEPFFITQEIEAELIATGYEFESQPIACMGRLRDVLESIERCGAGIAVGRDRGPGVRASTEQAIFNRIN